MPRDIKMTSPLVSVIIPTNDASRRDLLFQALNSLEKQDLDPSLFEVIVVTNYEFVLTMPYGFRFKIILTDERRLGAKLVIGAENANSEILSFLEDDDIFYPDKLSHVVDIFSKDNRIGYYKGALSFISDKGDEIQVYNFPDVRHGYYFAFGASLLKDISPSNIGNFHSVVSSIVVKKEIIERNRICISKINFDSDLAIFLSAVDSDAGIYLDPTQHTKYRIHASGSRSTEHSLDLYSKFTESLVTNGISVAKGLLTCIKSKDVATLLQEIIARRELELLRWKDIKIVCFANEFMKYFRLTKPAHYDIRFVALDIMFFFFPRKMRTLYRRNNIRILAKQE